VISGTGRAAACPLRVAVLASGRGSNVQALLTAFPAGHPLAQIVCAIGNRPGSPALKRAGEAGVPTHLIARGHYPSRPAQDMAIVEVLRRVDTELAVLAGYDQILTAPLLDAFAGRMINIHPSLLPAFAGTLHAQADALRYGVKVSGCTVHFVTAAVDGGPIIAQAAVPVLEEDDEATLSARILEQEHRLLPAVVTWIAEGRVQIEGSRVGVAAALNA
jgi:phosphoribosylglycinamide formyltransferase-1